MSRAGSALSSEISFSKQFKSTTSNDCTNTSPYLHRLEYSEFSKTQGPHAPSVTNLFKHFGGLDLEEESNFSEEDDIISEVLISTTQNPDKLSRTSIATISESQETGHCGVLKTYFVLMKGFIGIGILYIPAYYKLINYIVSSGILLIVALILLWGLISLVRCREKMKVAYPSIAELASGRFLQFLVSVWLFAGQVMYGIAYLSYIVSNTASMVMYEVKEPYMGVNWGIGALLGLLIAPLMCIRRPDRFYILFVTASIFIIIALISFTIPRIRTFKLFPPGHEFKLEDVAEFIGICLFSFEGYGIVIPSHQQMGEKKYFGKILAICIASVSLFYAFFGILTASEVNKDFHSAIIFKTLVDKLDFSKNWAYVVSSVYMSCLIPGYFLIMYPAVRILEKTLKYFSRENGNKLWMQNTLRITLVVITVVVATAWDHDFEEVLTAIGFFICVPLAVIIPAFAHMKLVAVGKLQKFADTILLIIGLGLTLVGILYFCHVFKDIKINKV